MKPKKGITLGIEVVRMDETKLIPICKCPRCSSNAEILSEEDDGTDRNEMYWCYGCKEAFVIRTGTLVDEWARELVDEHTKPRTIELVGEIK